MASSDNLSPGQGSHPVSQKLTLACLDRVPGAGGLAPPGQLNGGRATDQPGGTTHQDKAFRTSEQRNPWLRRWVAIQPAQVSRHGRHGPSAVRPFDLASDPIQRAGWSPAFEAKVRWQLSEGHEQLNGFFTGVASTAMNVSLMYLTFF